ncbi:hypothetical protein Ddye_025722 [Dipteronia dyeriana]|uniref:Uncharacterized protein n=1 Tax=Dipteronia dyeriana TaxID=168575 RepID=A0AAD9TKS2_9ROSI|nr:hypothetical protein Ddye_025722 [Dipteronia dyeriana]
MTSSRIEADCMEIYAKEMQKVYETLDKLPGKIILRANVWDASSSDDSSKYLCLTTHYVDEDCGANSSNIVRKIKNRLSQSKFLDVDGKLFDVPCATYIVKVMVQEAIEALCEVTLKLMESIRFVRSSVSRQEKFNELALQVGVKSLTFLCVDNLSQ